MGHRKAVMVDTNVLVGAFNESDSLYQKANRAWDSITGPMIFTNELIAEILTVLRMRTSEEVVKMFLEILQRDPRVILLGDKHFTETLVAFSNSGYKKLSFVDIQLVILSKKYEIITFDKELEKAIKN